MVVMVLCCCGYLCLMILIWVSVIRCWFGMYSVGRWICVVRVFVCSW